MDIIISVIVLFTLLGLIVFACVIFTNAIEHLGFRLNLSQGAVGSVLAAVGTALPETIVPIVAIVGSYLFHKDIAAGNEIGIGAILGAPFLLGTLAFFVTGVAVYLYAYKGRRTKDMPVNASVMKRDMHYFMAAYFVAILASFIPFYYVKVFLVVLLLTCYTVYVYLTVKDKSVCEVSHDELDALYFAKCLPDNLVVVLVQVFFSVGLIIILAHYFVANLENIAHIINISPLILSLIITPIATELPEKFNSVIWIRSNKDTLALGNITGAMVFQSCIPTSVGILLTPWILDRSGILSVILVYISILLVYLNLHMNKNILKPWILVISGIFYLIFLMYLLYTILETT